MAEGQFRAKTAPRVLHAQVLQRCLGLAVLAGAAAAVIRSVIFPAVGQEGRPQRLVTAGIFGKRALVVGVAEQLGSDRLRTGDIGMFGEPRGTGRPLPRWRKWVSASAGSFPTPPGHFVRTYGGDHHRAGSQHDRHRGGGAAPAVTSFACRASRAGVIRPVGRLARAGFRRGIAGSSANSWAD